MQPQKISSQSAFTLVEMAIVLVIMGLLVGGVLAGRDLIQAAKIKSTAQQMTDVDQAVGAFKLKYNAIPGDMANAASFWPTMINGNGNGRVDVITGCAALSSSSPDCFEFRGERGMFFAELGVAGLAKSYALFNGAVGTAPTLETHYPSVKLHPNMGMIVTGPWDGQDNAGVGAYTTDSLYLFLGVVSPATLNVNPTFNGRGLATSTVFTTREAANIDAKIDDGAPLSGNVVGVATATHCVSGIANANIAAVVSPGSPLAAPGTYDTASDDLSTHGCNLLYSLAP